MSRIELLMPSTWLKAVPGWSTVKNGGKNLGMLTKPWVVPAAST